MKINAAAQPRTHAYFFPKLIAPEVLDKCKIHIGNLAHSLMVDENNQQVVIDDLKFSM